MVMDKRIIFHIDCNSAFLSWEAVHRLQHGHSLDLRTVPSAVGGSVKQRRGIILARSIPAKKLGIRTGQTVFEALSKCPELILVPPDYALYVQCSNALITLLKEYSPLVERYSVDECFMDLSGYGIDGDESVDLAMRIKQRVKEELGFTVNIGISINKLLAKMASEFEKPDKVHTLFPEEMPEKMWPLPVCEMFMVGVRTCLKLYKYGIITIGQLAKTDKELLKVYFKSYGNVLWEYANGIDYSEVRPDRRDIKGIGNSTTTSFDVTDYETAKLFLLSLSEMVGMRLRMENVKAQVICVHLRNSLFHSWSHQHKIPIPTNATNDIYQEACRLFLEMWNGQPLRALGVRTDCLSDGNFTQLSITDQNKFDKISELDKSVDYIRTRYGNDAVKRGVFLHSGVAHINGGVHDDYPMMSSLL
jgi:DNA polymerase-4